MVLILLINTEMDLKYGKIIPEAVAISTGGDVRLLCLSISLPSWKIQRKGRITHDNNEAGMLLSDITEHDMGRFWTGVNKTFRNLKTSDTGTYFCEGQYPNGIEFQAFSYIFVARKLDFQQSCMKK